MQALGVVFGLGLVAAPAGAAPTAPPPSAAFTGATLDLDLAVAVACRDGLPAILARLDLALAEVEVVAAGMWQNPEVAYQMANIVLGRGYDQEQNIDPSTFSQLQHTPMVQGPVDLWFKRTARRRAAQAGVGQAQLELADAWRELRLAVAQAFAEVVRHQAELELAEQSHARYSQTLEICRRRRALGDISQAELEKIELEELRYIEQETDSTASLAGARLSLAQLMALESAHALPPRLSLPLPVAEGLDEASLADRARAKRPDLAAEGRSVEAAELGLAAARRERLPDPTLGVAYLRSHFQASGDNPHSLGVSVGLPLPLFDRNQAGIGAARATLTRARATYDARRRAVGYDVAAAAVAWRRASRRLEVLDGGMVARAQRAQSVAARAWQAGATSLLDFLEADRTYLELELQRVQAQSDVRLAAYGLHWAVGEAW